MDINQVFLQGTVCAVSSPTYLKNNQLELRFKLSTTGNYSDKENTQTHQIYLRLNSQDIVLDKYLPLLNVGSQIFVKGVLKNFIYVDALGKAIPLQEYKPCILKVRKNFVLFLCLLLF